MDSQPKYETVSITDLHDHEEALSTTEVDESLIGEENPWQRQRASKKETCMTVFTSYRWMLDTILLLIIIGLLLLLRHEWNQHEKSSVSRQVGGDYSGDAPIFATTVVKFQSDTRFAPLNSSEFFTSDNLALWNTMMPAGTGNGAFDASQAFFTTSMTHQLHCVYMMARIFSGLVLNTTQPLPANALPDDWHFHFLHCVDYMRQAVMCAADLAMEPHEPDDLAEGALDAGWNARHVCKEYGQVKGYLEEQISDGARVVLAIDD